MESEQLVSIIVPCKQIDEHANECIVHCLDLDYERLEILVLPDAGGMRGDPRVKVVPTGALTPGAKRNLAMKESTGSILAFIDSDAYPRRDWLRTASGHLRDATVSAVGGPGVTPDADNDMQKGSGFVLSSFLVGTLRRRYSPGSVFYSDDIHSCNFVAKREIMERVKWNEKYWPGEDTLLSLDLSKLGVKMLEAEDVVVYHHRRELFLPHLKQVSSFGLHRGLFFRKYPGNSRKVTYVLPSMMVLCAIALAAMSAFNPPAMKVFLGCLLIYSLMVLAGALPAGSVKLIALTWIGIILTHIAYGISFMIGISRRDLER